MANEKKKALYNVLNKSLGENLQQGFDQTVEDIRTNPTLGMIGNTLSNLPGLGEVVPTMTEMENSSYMQRTADAFKQEVESLKQTAPSVFTPIEAQDKTPAVTTEGAAVQKSQAAAGTAGTTLGDASGTGAQSNMQIKDSPLGMSIYDGNKTTLANAQGYATMAGNRLGGGGYVASEGKGGGDWVSGELADSVHKQGMARLRAGLPYDAKEAATAMQQNKLARQQQSLENDQFVEDYYNRRAREQAVKDLTLGATSNINMGGKRRAALLSEAEALRVGGTEDQTSFNRGFSTARQQLGATAAGTPKALSEKDVFDMLLKQEELKLNKDRFGLEQLKAGTEQQRFGLTAQEKQAEAMNRAQRMRLDATDKASAIWANPNITSTQDKRRQALGLLQQSGMSPQEAQFETLQTDPEARAAIEKKDWAALSAMYDRDVVDAYRMQLQKRQLGYPQ